LIIPWASNRILKGFPRMNSSSRMDHWRNIGATTETDGIVSFSRLHVNGIPQLFTLDLLQSNVNNCITT